jgi:hypothetical protein
LPRQRLRWVNCFNHSINPERVESNAGFHHHRVMPQSLAKILVHTVPSTKDRRPFLRDKSIREELHRYYVIYRMAFCRVLDCNTVLLWA